MLSKYIKRCLLPVITLVTVFSLLPLQALGTEAKSGSNDTEAQPNMVQEGIVLSEPALETNETLVQIEAAIDDILTRYLGSTNLSDEEILKKVEKMDWETYQTARWEISELENDVWSAVENGNLTKEELSSLNTQRIAVFSAFSNALEERAANDDTITTYATASTLGLDFSSTNSGKISASDNSATLSVTATNWYNMLGSVNEDTTVTITNSTGTKATITFTYTFEGGTFTINDVDENSGTSCSVTLESGSSFSIYLKATASYLSSQTSTFKMTNITVTPIIDEATVTVLYDEALGRVNVGTASGTKVNNNTTVETTKDSPTTLVATANSSQFLAWVDPNDNNKVLSRNVSYTVSPTATAMTVKAVFATTTPWFFVNDGNNLVQGLDTATGYAGTIVLANNATLPAGEYEIPSNATLLIPYDSNGSLYTTAPECNDGTWVQPSAFRTLTVSDNTTITINGAMTVGALQSAPGAGNTGNVTKKYGHVILNGTNAKIVVNGDLYCHGYITGTGMVHATTGAEVYELFQIRDWRGGSATLSWYMGSYKSFVVNEYFIQNIETTYRVDTGALSYVSAAMTMTGIGTQQTSTVYIGDGGLFQLGENSFVMREYKPSEDRIYYDLYGTVTTAGINLTVSTYQLNTEKYILSIQHGMSITIKGTDLDGNILKSSAKITKAFKMLPGSELIVEENSTLEIDSGTSLFLYDKSDWLSSYIYSNEGTADTKVVKYTPSTRGSSSTLSSAILQVDGELIAYSNIFTTSNGGTSSDKVLIGTGKFTNNAAVSGYSKLTLDEMNNNADKATVTNVSVIGLLAGISTSATDVDDSFGTAVYHGLGANYNNYWYINSAEVAPTCTAGGYTKYWCTDVTQYYSIPGGNALGHDWISGICSGCGDAMIKFDKISLSIQGQVLLNLKFIIHEDVDKDNVTVTVTEEGNAIVKEQTWTEPLSKLPSETKEGVTHYVVSQGIAAGEMTGEVTVVFKDGDTALNIYDVYNEQVHKGSLTQTVLNYAERGLASGNEKDVALCTQMVIYGGYAQQFFEVDTGYPAYNILEEGADIDVSEAVLNQTATISDADIGITATTQKINLDSAIYMRTYFTLKDGHDIAEYTFKLTDPASKETQLEYGKEGSRYYVDIPNIPVAYWNDDYTITVSNGTDMYTIASSVLAWCARCVKQSSDKDEQNMARAMYFYCEAADAYFSES